MSSSNDHAHPADAWDSHATEWSSSIQSITAAPCTSLLSQAHSLLPLDTSNSKILDNGAGSGQLTTLIKSSHPAIPILACDLSPGMLSTIREKAIANNWSDVTTLVQDAQNLDQLSDGSFSHVFCTFVISFTEDPQMAVGEMHRVLRPGGVAGIATWSRVSWVPSWQTAVRKTQGGDPDYVAPPLFHTGTTELEWLQTAMGKAGFEEVKVEEFRCLHKSKTADEAVEEFYGMGNPSVKLLMKGFSEGFIESTKGAFRKAYSERWDGGRERQFEVALLAIGRKSA